MTLTGKLILFFALLVGGFIYFGDKSPNKEELIAKETARIEALEQRKKEEKKWEEEQAKEEEKRAKECEQNPVQCAVEDAYEKGYEEGYEAGLEATMENPWDDYPDREWEP